MVIIHSPRAWSTPQPANPETSERVADAVSALKNLGS